MTKERRGFFELILATFLFSLFGVFTRLISDYLGVFFQLLLRTLIMAILFSVFAWITRNIKKINKHDLCLLIFRGLLVVIDFSCFYIAVNHLQLGLALFLFYAANVIISFLFGSMFLKEKMNTAKYISISLALLGLFVMYKDSFVGVKMLPSLAALISGSCFGLTASTSKKLTDKYSSWQVNFIGYLTAFLLVIPVLFISRESFTFNLPILTWIELLGFASVGAGAFYLTLNGFNHLEAQKASIIMLAELIFVVLIGFLFYSEVPTLNTFLGGLLILSALLIPNLNIKLIKLR